MNSSLVYIHISNNSTEPPFEVGAHFLMSVLIMITR